MCYEIMKWEYKIKKIWMPCDFTNGFNLDLQYQKLTKEHQRILDELGGEGWEIYDKIHTYWYFKRCIQ